MAVEAIRTGLPVIIAGGLGAWPALSHWSFERLLRDHGDWVVPVSVFRHGALSPEKEMCRISELIPRILPFPSWPLCYLQQVPLAEWPRALAECIGPPPGLAPGTPMDAYLWCGPHGASSPLHYDTRDNLHVLLRGHKRFLLFAPDQSPLMYPHAEDGAQHLSRIDVERVDRRAFPRFGRARGLRCVLGPGEVLYLPTRWWHQVHLWAPSISVNFWWTKEQGATPQGEQRS
ncbi:cupin-like domain-containing protein [Myxococcus stipitatus]|uniref:cupin-like domain-containing protein n=1 Tax=Myxococcus stipitatus TaxID=83455 RepID=UPI003CC8AC3F